jgi:hypothetical protein
MIPAAARRRGVLVCGLILGSVEHAPGEAPFRQAQQQLPSCGNSTCQLQDSNCPGGSQFDFASENCTACPVGKQTQGGSARCGYCPESTAPNEARTACVCKIFHVNSWAANRTGDVCIPCAKVANCEPCQSTKLTTNGGGTGIADVVKGQPNCAGGSRSSHTCECTGGVPGVSANLCPSEGFYLHFSQDASDSYLEDVGDWTDPFFGVLTSQRVNAVHKLLPCGKHGSFSTARSRCRHWSECAGANQSTCNVTQNCCAPGYRGAMCEHCEPPGIRIAGACMICTGYDKNAITVALVVALGFVLYIVYSSTKNFRMADGTFTIMVSHAVYCNNSSHWQCTVTLF